MAFHGARLISASPLEGDWPKKSLPEVLFAGKSNVGKSSLINALCDSGKLAYVGKKPGRTRTLNFYETEERIRLVDAPGYGYAQRDRKRLNEFSGMMEAYFRRESCRAALVLLDARRELCEEDRQMKELADHYGLKLLLVLTKTDQLSAQQRKTLPARRAEEYGVRDAQVIWTSSVTKQGIEGLYQRILSLCRR